MLVDSPPQFRRNRTPAVKASPPAPPLPRVVITDVLAGDFAADWVFERDVVSVIDIAPLKISGGSPVWLDLVEGNVVRVSYDFAIDIGLPWTYDGSPVAVFDNGGILQPGSGETIEG